MNLSREFTQEVNGTTINFQVTYNPQTHFFAVVEDEDIHYTLGFNPATKEWTTKDGPQPAIPVDQLAQLVQKSFGVFV
ncbi:hypothetical protein H8B06_12395 [Sphingobacterium sp. DN00404]|uniref:Uncharacterized protein n=1 Tax=Sphingobacterium micropteri TaxID=2763501 RepID=A0ABR7YQP2_9SPHI|nr:hypothetical protein [Sphingobacterium micropteri]MBD1433630.1 hypothetical protein [Sphingobacterium micropteri]